MYADYTLFIGEASMANLWALKTIMCCFGLPSSLRVNFFSKNSTMEVNLDFDFLSLAEGFLDCRISSFLFIYLGLHVGVNSRRDITSKPLIQQISNRLGLWRNRFVSSGGRVVLINSILNLISIIYVSIMKLHTKAWNRNMGIQRCFLWGGSKGDKKIPSVS